MKKSKLLIVGLIAVVLAVGLLLAGCGLGCPGGGTSGGKAKCSGATLSPNKKECENRCIQGQSNPNQDGSKIKSCNCIR